MRVVTSASARGMDELSLTMEVPPETKNGFTIPRFRVSRPWFEAVARPVLNSCRGVARGRPYFDHGGIALPLPEGRQLGREHRRGARRGGFSWSEEEWSRPGRRG